MADWQSSLSLVFDETVRQYDEFLVDSPRKGRKLTPTEVDVYSSRAAKAGWRIESQVGDTQYEIDVLVDRNLPFSAPRIALVDKSKFLSWPHVERDGSLCLLPPHASINPSITTELIQYLLDEAVKVMTAGQEKTNLSDFVSEFHSYWSYVVDPKRPTIWSLLPPGSSNKYVVCWRGKKFTLVGENEKQLQSWLNNFFHEEKDFSQNFHKAVFLWLENPISPAQYPKANSDFNILVKKEKQETQRFFFDSLSLKEMDSLKLFGFETETGSAMGGVWLKKPSDKILQRGFRRGHTDKKIMTMRYLDTRRNLSAVTVQRVDHQWIHTRGGKSEAGQLRDKTVALIGCGSVGSLVAQVLVQAGVGRFILVDPDVLSWDNIARHALGGNYVGQNKAEAMAKYLSKNFPHIEILTANNDSWENCFRHNAEGLNNCDIVVATTGDWQAESALNYLHRTAADFPPVIFGWTEPHACAGHALFVHELGGCLSCGMDETGNFQFPVINWHSENTLKAIPACGGIYQPYGIVDLMPIVSMISDVIMKVLLGSICRSHLASWIGQESNYNNLGGTLTAYWSKYFKNEKSFEAQMIKQNWHINQDCHLCR